MVKDYYKFQKREEQEEYDLKVEIMQPIAKWFIDKMIYRVERILDGEDLGPMVESDLENLEVDYDFENHRQNIEVASNEDLSE